MDCPAVTELIDLDQNGTIELVQRPRVPGQGDPDAPQEIVYKFDAESDSYIVAP
jgi:hypothetical protein